MHDQRNVPADAVMEGSLDCEMIDAYFADLSVAAEVTHVQVRSTASTGGDRSTSLAELKQLIAAQEARAAQIRYRFDGATWCDTLLVQPTGIRLIRMQQSNSKANT